jgi:ankyrin repeat protein
MDEIQQKILKEAIELNDLEQVKRIFKKLGEFNRREFFLHALQYAAFNGQIEILEFLLDNGADVNENSGAFSPFYTAVRVMQFDAADYLVSKGADIENPDVNGFTDFLAACRIWEDIEQIRYLVNKGVNIHAKTNDGYNGLFNAIISSNIPLVKYLLELGLDINTVDFNGKSAVDHLISTDNIDMIHLFLKKHDALSEENKRKLNPYRLTSLFQ